MEETTKKINYILEDSNLSTEEAKAVVNTLIDNRINFFKINHLSEWEKDHSITSKTLNEKIVQLNERRKQLISEIDNKANVKSEKAANTSFGFVFQKA